MMKTSRRQYYMINFILIFVALAVSFVMAILIMYQDQKRLTEEKTGLLTGQACNELNDILNGVDMLSRSMFMDEGFQDAADSLYTDAEALTKIYAHFNLMISMDDFYKNAAYVPRNAQGELDLDAVVNYGFGYEYFQYNMPNIIALAQKEENKNGKAFFTQLYHEDGTAVEYFAVARNIYDMRPYGNYFEPMGVGIVFLNGGHLVNLLNKYSLALDGLEFCILHNNEDLAHSADFNKVALTDKGYTKPAFELSSFSWSLVGTFERAYIWDSIQDNLMVIIVILSVASASCILLAVFVKRRSARSLDYLFNSFSALQKDKAIEVIPHSDDEEVNQVIDSFNGLVQSVKGLNDEILERKNKELMLELQTAEYMLTSLHAQINKHFLINILSLLRFFVSSGETQKAKSCIEDLSEFLRGALTIDDEGTVEQELAMVRSYLNIQANRYPRVKFEIDCPEECLEKVIPKMILQPIVENVYIHALPKKSGNIRLVCKACGEFVKFFIIDDGQGLEEEKVAKLNRCFKEGQKVDFSSGNGIALDNINQRLRLLTGEQSCMRIVSRKGRGTIVILKIHCKENL